MKDYIASGRRLAVKKSEHMDDWYVSYSPRNDNSNAEGDWAEWVDLAERILAEDKVRQMMPPKEK
jgi:hypothetical protein